MLMRLRAGSYVATTKKLQKRNGKCLQEATSEKLKLNTTNTLWSDLADRCFENLKKSKIENNHTPPCSRGSGGK
jgi:PIN domain nuclease of toxin-antitoxin system